MAGAKDLNWAAAVAFLERCQNLPSHNHASWVKGDPKNLGGFVYDPLNKKGLLSYGSMSYAGLLSYIHADLKKDDPRVTAVFDWLRHNYTLEENPGMGADGLYYYYHMMSKALSAHGTETLPMAEGKEIAWASDLALKLINLQQTDGSWVNSSGRWWEKDPTLVTSYAVRTLEIIHSGLIPTVGYDSNLRPLPEQIMIDAGELHRGLGGHRLIGEVAAQPLDAQIEIEEQRPLAVVPHHALNPEKGTEPHATADRIDVVQARRRVKHEVPRRQLHALHAVSIFHHQFAAVVFIRRGEKERRREIGAQPVRRARNLPDRIVDMGAERLAAGIAIEKRWDNMQRQRRR